MLAELHSFKLGVASLQYTFYSLMYFVMVVMQFPPFYSLKKTFSESLLFSFFFTKLNQLSLSKSYIVLEYLLFQILFHYYYFLLMFQLNICWKC